MSDFERWLKVLEERCYEFGGGCYNCTLRPIDNKCLLVEFKECVEGKVLVDESDLEFLISEFTNAKFKSDLKRHEKIKNKY